MRIAKEIAQQLDDDMADNNKAYGDSHVCQDYVEAMIAAKLEPVREALEGLYRHTKNNAQICGLNYSAEQALFVLSEEE